MEHKNFLFLNSAYNVIKNTNTKFLDEWHAMLSWIAVQNITISYKQNKLFLMLSIIESTLYVQKNILLTIPIYDFTLTLTYYHGI